jgi:protoheme IX farnesyltransferase
MNARDLDLDYLSMAEVSDYWALLKPRVMSLVIFTAWVGQVLAPGEIHPVIAAVALLCIAVGAGASGALNMWYDADIDSVMKRTASRPLPQGQIKRHDALTYGLLLSVFSVVTLGLLINWLSAALLAFTIFFYAVIYTMWLKRWTVQNIVIGGAAGALPPVIGWASVTGSTALEPWILFLIIFVWTPPHFWALAILQKDAYAAAKVPMLPNVAGLRSTQNHILAYAVIMLPVGLLPWLFGFASWTYGVFAGITGLIFVGMAFQLWQTKDNHSALKKRCGRLFGYSILYLFALFAYLVIESFIIQG